MNPTIIKAVLNMLNIDADEIQTAMKNFAALAQEIDERSKRMEAMFASIDARLAAIEKELLPSDMADGTIPTPFRVVAHGE